MTKPIETFKTDKLNIVFSASSFDLFELCECRFNYGHNMRKSEPPDKRSKALDYGALCHKGLEVYFNSLSIGDKFADRMHKTLMKIREVASSEESNINISEELTPLTSAIEQSCDFWRSEDEQLEVLAAEAPFDYILYEDDFIRIIISGKIDLLVNVHGIGNNASYINLPFDHKTFSRTFPTIRLNNQFMNYCVATGSNYLIVNKIGLQKTLDADKKFLRIPLSYDPVMFEQWKDNVIKVIIDKYLTCVKTGNWHMNFMSCQAFGRLCEFHPVCDSSGQEAKDYKLASLYMDKAAWDKYEDND